VLMNLEGRGRRRRSWVQCLGRLGGVFGGWRGLCVGFMLGLSGLGDDWKWNGFRKYNFYTIILGYLISCVYFH